ncbi:hypothetical protein LSH36_1137g00072 [Paralvinella palmiformis]|uniref:Uncharacterized protein n=1 Tax=Paralvinella palmiformis TaxID=53620 RepID=A0AAD9IV18_9ANNE|nr:hypothetical protein LSH36_1137g00072 [Paralvinella palmiformis]
MSSCRIDQIHRRLMMKIAVRQIPKTRIKGFLAVL